MKILSRNEIDIIRYGLSSPEKLDMFTDYWFGKPDGRSFRFDHRFEEKYRWQKKLIFASQPLIVGIMGIGTGKTLGVGMAAASWGIGTESFKFMNGAFWAYQTKLMYLNVLETITDTPSFDMINTTETPYPKITFSFKAEGQQFKSTMEFMSMEKNAVKIFSWRGDWINLDEAGLIENLDQVLQNLSTRLTGHTARGRPYLGRMSLMTNTWDNDASLHIYGFADMAARSPDECLSISIPTSGNKNVTDQQIKNTLIFIPDKEEQRRLLEAERPEGKGRYFSRERVTNCEDEYLTDYLLQGVENNTQGFHVEKAMALGAVEYRMPASDYVYLMGDPGSANFPARNSPVIVAVDVDGFPERPMRVVGFWWGAGNGSIQTFVNQFYRYREIFKPIVSGVDSTGPQSGMVQLMNLSVVFDIKNDIIKTNHSPMSPIYGLDFSTGRKYMMLLAHRNFVELGLIKWASIARGIRAQHVNYDPALDRAGVPKIAQDIVAAFSMASYVIRADFQSLFDEDRSNPERDIYDEIIRNIRRSDDARNIRR